MSLILSFDHYKVPLDSLNEDTVKAALQKIFELLVKGYRIPRTRRKDFLEIINKHVQSDSKKVRKWAYHCACYYQNIIICKSIIIQLQTEKHVDNIMWALAALSVCYNDKLKLKQCVGKRHDEFINIISKTYLDDALALFGRDADINVNRMLSNNYSADLATLALIYRYSDLTEGKYPDVILPVIRDLEAHEDPFVREYAYWAQLTAHDPKEDYSKQASDPVEHVRRHQIALQIINGDEDYVACVLKEPAMRSESIHKEIKYGILRGVSEKPYSSKYVSSLISWFDRETSESILLQLLNYFLSNCLNNREDGTFFDVIKDSLSDENLSSHIINTIHGSLKYGLMVTINESTLILDYISKGDYGMKIEVKGSENTVVVANHKSTATVVSGAGNSGSELKELLKAVLDSSKKCLTNEDIQIVEDSVDAISEEAERDEPRKNVINSLLNGLKALKGTAEFSAAVATLINFFK